MRTLVAITVALFFAATANAQAYPSTAEAFDAFFRAQMVQWGKVIKAANIRVE